MNYCRCIPIWNACSCTGWETTARPENTQIKSPSKLNSCTSKKPWVSVLGDVSPFFLFTPKAVQCKHIEYCNFAESHGEKWCLDPKEEEYVTLHSVYLDKNNYSYWERNFKSCKLYASSCMFPVKGPQNWAALAKHCGETLDKSCYEDLLCELLCVTMETGLQVKIIH